MKIFTTAYEYILNFSNKEKATKYLYGLSFIESFIFPIPPDVLLAPIALTKKYSWLKIAFNTTVFSVLGGLVGYVIGLYLYELSFLNKIIDEKTFLEVKRLFNEHGIIIIIIAGFTPLPFKAFTITAGYMSLSILPFLLASFIGRALRFFLVAGLFHYFGIKVANKIKNYFEYLGWIIISILIYSVYLKFF